MPTRPPPTLVMGLGNVLMGDDALGPTVIHNLLARYSFPEGVRVEDLGTPGLDLYPHLAGVEIVIVVDTVRANARPGELRLYRKADLLRTAPGERVASHDPGLKQALHALEFAGQAPREALLVGVVPERTQQQVGLSTAVRLATAAAESAVLAELSRLGYLVSPLDPPRPADPWWESAPRPVGYP